MRTWIPAAVCAAALAGLPAADASAQEPENGARLEQQPLDEARVERFMLLGGPDAEIGVSIGDLEDRDGAERGARVDDVRSGSPAAGAGIEKGDVITQFDGERVRSARQLSRLVAETPPGRAVAVTVMRDGRRLDLKVTPRRGEASGGFAYRAPRVMPSPPMRGAPLFRFDDPHMQPWVERFSPELAPGLRGRGRLGVTAQALSPQLGEYFGAAGGVLVSSVRDDSPAAKAGLRAGDVITAVDDRKVGSPEELVRAIAEAESAEVTIAFVRDRKAAQIRVTLPAPERPTGRTRPV